MHLHLSQYSFNKQNITTTKTAIAVVNGALSFHIPLHLGLGAVDSYETRPLSELFVSYTSI